uniref:Uncharacterized protein n=1 Tax=Romanomermis culicivorax TaxID=13658 RepID=A0A915IAH5_ROMCU
MATLDVYVNIMQAAESAESSFAVIRGGSKDVHAVGNNSCRDSDRYLNHGPDQSLHRSKRPQSSTRYDQSCDLGYRYDRGATIGH